MINCKKLSLGLVVATILATPAMAQGGKQELGAPGVHHQNSRYLAGGYGVRATPVWLLLRKPVSPGATRRRVCGSAAE